MEVHTDSQYVALFEPIDCTRIDKDLSYHPLMSMVKPDLMDEDLMDGLKAMLYGHCVDEWEPDHNIHFLPEETRAVVRSPVPALTLRTQKQ